MTVQQKTRPAGLTLQTAQETTKQRATAIRDRMAAAKQSEAKLKGAADELQDALSRGDIDKVRILTSTIESARKDTEANTRDLAQAMMSLGDMSKDIGLDLESVQKLNEKELAVIQSAKDLVEQKKAEVAVSQQGEVLAAQKINLFGMRDKAVGEAKAKTVALKTELATAEAGIKAAEQLAETMKRQRLESMSLEESLQQMQVTTQEIVELAKARLSEIEGNIQATEVGRLEVVEKLKEHAKLVDDGDKAIAQARAEESALRAQQKDVLENSPEWMQLKGDIDAKVNEIASIEAERNKAFTLSQDGQRFLEMYRVQEVAQRGLLQFHQIWIATLEEGMRQRSTLYESQLGIVKASSDQEAMSLVDKIGVETDERLTEDGVRHLQGIRKNMVSRLERMPENLRRLRQITATEAESRASFDASMTKLLEEFHKNFGTEKGYDDAASYKDTAA